jgi:hypothetical protein
MVEIASESGACSDTPRRFSIAPHWLSDSVPY